MIIHMVLAHKFSVYGAWGVWVSHPVFFFKEIPPADWGEVINEISGFM